MEWVRCVAACSALPALTACVSSGGKGGEDTGVVSECEATTGLGVQHEGAIDTDETWSAADSPHLVTSGVQVEPGARLEIEPCAEVRVAPAVSLVIDGELVAEGTASRPIVVTADDAGQPWGFLQVFAPGTARLTYVTLEGGGGETVNSWGALEARGDQELPAQEVLSVDHVTVLGSAAYGVSLRAGAAFTADSRDLVVTGSALAPLRILPRLGTNVPEGDYTGNGTDAIVIATEAYGDVGLEDVTLHDRGVPYHVGDSVTQGLLRVRGESSAVTLTLDPGVTLAFAAGGRLEVDSDGPGAALVAAGTSEAPVVFTSAVEPPSAGDWVGLVFDGVPAARSRLEHAELRHAGGPSMADGFHCEPDGSYSTDEDTAVSIYGEPASAFITDSLVEDSGRIGVNLAYHGETVDFAATNTFTDVPGCDVSWPRDNDGNCPDTSPCD